MKCPLIPSSVASFLVLGGGASPPNVPTEKNHVHVTYMPERASQKHIGLYIQVLAYICMHTQSMQSPFIMVWRYKRQYQTTTNILEIYEYASERAWKIFAFSHSKTAISFNIILLVLLILYLRNIYIFRSQIYNQCSSLLLRMVWRYYITDSIPTKH